MDIRDTLVVEGTFLSLLRELQARGAAVALLADCDGLTRLEGRIRQIEEAPEPAQSTLTLDNGTHLKVGELIAVNGTFRSDYSEC